MKYWRCPECHRERFWNQELRLKICNVCQVEMEVFDDGEPEED